MLYNSIQSICAHAFSSDRVTPAGAVAACLPEPADERDWGWGEGVVSMYNNYIYEYVSPEQFSGNNGYVFLMWICMSVLWA